MGDLNLNVNVTVKLDAELLRVLAQVAGVVLGAAQAKAPRGRATDGPIAPAVGQEYRDKGRGRVVKVVGFGKKPGMVKVSTGKGPGAIGYSLSAEKLLGPEYHLVGR
jgi:hypothetical protein